jgi:thiamine monophosphate synthase
MFIIKNNYYLYIENTRSVNLNYIRKNKKICFIYRESSITENKIDIRKFRNKCRVKGFKFYVANNYSLSKYCKADGIYLSSYNKKKYSIHSQNLIGSAHNFREIYEKMKQGCDPIVLSRLFETSYKNKKNYLGVIKFNLMVKKYKINIVPLGGINSKNLLKLNIVSSKGLCLLSEIKKKPVISNRLF